MMASIRQLIVYAMTKDEQHRRIINAAIEFVYDGCANALMELEDSVVDLIGIEVGSGRQQTQHYDRSHKDLLG